MGDKEVWLYFEQLMLSFPGDLLKQSLPWIKIIKLLKTILCHSEKFLN